MRLLTTLADRFQRLRRDTSGIAALEFALVLVPMVLLFIAGAEMTQAVILSKNIETVAFSLVDLTSQQATCSNQSNAIPTCYGDSSSPPSGQSISTTLLDTQILPAATAVMGSAPTSTLKLTLTAVDVVNKVGSNGRNGPCCDFIVRWSYQMGGGTLRGGVPSGSSCTADTLTQVNAVNTAPAPTNIASSLLPPQAAAGLSLPLGANEAVLIADVSYVYQPPIAFNGANFIPTFVPTMTSTRYMFPRLPGQVVLAGSTSTVTGTNGNTGQICF